MIESCLVVTNCGAPAGSILSFCIEHYYFKLSIMFVLNNSYSMQEDQNYIGT